MLVSPEMMAEGGFDGDGGVGGGGVGGGGDGGMCTTSMHLNLNCLSASAEVHLCGATRGAK